MDLYIFLNIALVFINGILMLFNKKWKYVVWFKVYAIFTALSLTLYYLCFINIRTIDWYYYLVYNQIGAVLLLATFWELTNEGKKARLFISSIFAIALIAIALTRQYNVSWHIRVWLPFYIANITVLFTFITALKNRNTLHTILGCNSVIIAVSYPVRIFLSNYIDGNLFRYVEITTQTVTYLLILLLQIPGFSHAMRCFGRELHQRISKNYFVRDIVDYYQRKTRG